MKRLRHLLGAKDLHKRFEAARPRLYRTAYAWTHNPVLADDLTQEALAKAVQKAGQLREPRALETWLFSILVNCWRDHLRSHKRIEDLDNVTLLTESTPETLHGEQQLVDKVRAAIQKLPEGQREVVALVDLEGFSYTEVAKILDIPIGTVMSRLCRAHNALKERLLRQFDRRPSTLPTRFRRIK